MNLDLFKQGLIMETAGDFSWEELDAGSDAIKLGTYIDSAKYNTEICMTVKLHKDATLLVTFIFDSISYNKETLALTNYFNKGMFFLKAYIEQKRRRYRLVLEYATPNCDSVEQASKSVQEMIDLLNSDCCAEYLLPLTVVTEI